MTDKDHAAAEPRATRKQAPNIAPIHACRQPVYRHIRPMLPLWRLWWATSLGVLAVSGAEPASAASDAAPARYDDVTVEPTKTSIYLGSVSMTMTGFARSKGGYEGRYVAKVFPFIFYNETGTLRVEISDDLLRKLAAGETIEFHGQGVRDDGATRRVEGKATPASPSAGKLKVRVFYSKRIELIFNTTYRFGA